MVDVHSHILPTVDDGSPSFENSLLMLSREAKNGVNKVVFTPHYKTGIYENTPQKLIEVYNEFVAQIKQKGINITTGLGQEIYVTESIYEDLKQNKYLTMNGSKCILVEFNYFDEVDILDYVYNLHKLGYTPIIAHIERYSYFDWQNLYEIKMLGGLIQVNASCVLGHYGKGIQENVFRAIHSGYIDFVASDVHSGSEIELKKAYKKVSHKFGKEVADKLFNGNAEKYIFSNKKDA